MRKLFILLSITYITYSCTKTVTQSYQSPKAIASNWDTLKQNWNYNTNPIDNYILAPNLDSSILFYGTIRVFIKVDFNIISLPFPLESIAYLGTAFIDNINEVSFFTQLKRINLIVKDTTSNSRNVLSLLNFQKSSMYFRYILIPNASAPNARLQSNGQDIRTMDYPTLCNYLNIKE